MSLSLTPQTTEDEEDYTPSATITTFPHPLSLLRIPIPTSSSSSSFTLAYKSPQSFSNSFNHSLSKLLSDCQSAARISSALTASRLCQPPWWRRIFGGISGEEFAERGRCEERETEACFEAAKGKCAEIVRERCWRGFRDAKVWVGGERGTEVKRGSDLIGDGFGDLDAFRK